MKTWKCTVCGYSQESESPPEKCPVCGADKNEFIEITKKGGQEESKLAAAGVEKIWKCTVCGYIQKSAEPPDECPVCGADRSQFIEIFQEDSDKESGKEPDPVETKPVETKPAETKSAETKPVAEKSEAEPDTKEMAEPDGRPAYLDVYDKVTELMTEHHIHPISVHIPNGVLPLSVIFVILAVVFRVLSLDLPAFYSLIYVLLAMPLVLFSGYNDWKKIYGGSLTRVFYTKMICGAAVFLIALVLVIWRAVDPDVATSPERWPYLLIHLLMLGAAGIAGHLGGKLVFGKRDA
ncbi:rubredoxin [Desulfococcaceae bacterium HSG8]|nr:rubredoxin [Desulfococcaceae bacterium HSG8]